MSPMHKAKIIELPKIHDPRGNMSIVESSNHIPFDVQRSYWIYDVPGGEVRGAHAFQGIEEFIIALSGSFDVILDDGMSKRTFSLNRSYYGLYVPAMTWRTLENFSTNSLCLILASKPYDKSAYIRDFDHFQKLSGESIHA